MIEFNRGNTVRFSFGFKDWNKQYTDPDSVVFTIKNSHDELLREVDITANKTATGKFYFDFILPEVSEELKYKVVGMYGAYPSRRDYKITVV